ncbi:CHAT domain-containing protein [bacterium]|nr:CHAT domain-containing protein [bacterium]
MKQPRLLLASLLVGALAPVAAQPPEMQVEGFLTSAKGSEYQPTVSADGNWLVYASESDGAAALHRLDLRGIPWRADLIRKPTRPQPPKPLFPHPAATTEPVFSPTGDAIAFVSRRDDALGDVYIASSITGQARRLSQRGARDSQPRFTPDGKYLEWTSIAIDGTANTQRWSIAEKTFSPGEVAATQERANPPGFVASYSPDGSLALVYTTDTNVDGSRGPGDDPVAMEWRDNAWRQVSTPIAQARGIARNPVTGEIIVAGKFLESQDIVVLRDAPLRTATAISELLDEAARLQTRWGADSELALACLAKAATEPLNGSDSPKLSTDALLRYARALNRKGRHAQAAQLLSERMPAVQDEIMQLRLEAQFLNARQQLAQRLRRENPFALSPMENIEGRLRVLMGRFREAGLVDDAAEAGLTLATFYLNTDRYLDAAGETEKILAGESANDDLKSRTILFRANLFTRMELGSETRGALIQLLELNPPSVTVKDDAAKRLIDQTIQQATERDESPVIALRGLASQAEEIPWLSARVLIAEARQFENFGDRASAIDACQRALRFAEQAPEPTLDAARNLLRLATAAGTSRVLLEQVAEMAQSIAKVAPGTRIEADARDLLISAWLDKARSQAILGDPALALSSFAALIEREPTNLDAYRGLYDAAAANPAALALETEKARAAVSAEKDSALAWYRLALAQSYEAKVSTRPVKSVERALLLDGTKPQFYLLKGFLLEQLYDEGKRNGKASIAYIDGASQAYEQGLALVDRSRSPRLYADFVLNSANAASSLSQYFKANDLYREREALGIPLEPWQREMIFHWNAGMAAFQASDPRRAVRQFDMALDVLAKHPSAANGDAVRYELMGRRALAFMDQDRFVDASEAFEQSLALAPADSLARVRLIRNLAFMWERQASSPTEKEPLTLLLRARARAEEALLALQSPTLKPDRDYTRSGGLIDINIAFSTDAVGGGAKLGFDRSDEERLLHALLGRIEQRLGQPAAAITHWDRQMALDPKMDDTSRAYYSSLRAVTLNRLADASHAIDETDAALSQAQQGLALTHYTIALQEIMNGGGAVQLVTQIAELRLSSDASLNRDPATWWMIPPAELAGIDSDWELLDRAADRLLSIKDPILLDGSLLIIDPTDEAKLSLVRALANEQLARSMSPQDPIAGVRSGFHYHSAVINADRVISAYAAASDTQLAARLSFLAWGVKIRASLLSTLATEALASPEIDAAKAFAEETGQSHLEWWLYSTIAIHAPDASTRAAAANAALSAFAESPIPVLTDQDANPWLLFDTLEGIMLTNAKSSGDAIAAWNTVDAWRVVRQRWMLRGLTFPNLRGDQAEWYDRFVGARDAYAASQVALQRIGPANPALRVVEQENSRRAKATLQDVIDEGRRMGYSIAQVLVPVPGGYDTLSAIFDIEPSFLLDREVAGSRFIAIYTREAQRFVEAVDSAPAIVFGDGRAASSYPDALHILNTAGLFQSYMKLSLAGASIPLVYTVGAPPANNALYLATSLQVSEAVIPASGNPADWVLSGSNRTLGSVLDSCRSLEAISLKLAWPASLPTREQQARRLGLLAWLEGRGIVTATLDGTPWLGKTLDPRENRDLAVEELSVHEFRLRVALEKGRSLEGIQAIRDRIFIKEALGLEELNGDNGTEYLWIDYQNLARLQLNEGNPAEALEASRRSLELLRRASTDPQQIADGLILVGDCASHANDLPVAREAYNEVIAIQQAASDEAKVIAALLSRASAEEVAGEFDAAIASTNEAISLMPSGSRLAPMRARQRIARIMIRLQNRYAEGEAIIAQIIADAQAEGIPDAEFEALILRARCEQDTARFEESAKSLDAAEALAATDLDKVRVTMERGQNHWLLSDYFNAFREQQKASEQLAQLESTSRSPEDEQLYRVLRFSNRNLSGLISWSVNDLKRAYGELDQALTLAEKYRIDSEIASTCNNRGLVLRSEARYDEAATWFGRAWEIDERYNNRWGRAYSHRNIGINLSLAGRAEEALPHLRTAVELSRSIGDGVNETKSLVALGDALLDLRLYSDSVANYTQALELARRIPLREMEWRALYGLGRLAIAENKSDEALAHISEAVEVVDNLRAAIRVEEFQNGFLLDKQDLYDSLVRLELDRGNAAAALESSEKSRGRSFIDLLGNRRLNLGNVQDQSLLDQEKRLRLEIEMAERQLQVATATDAPPIAARLAQLKSEYSDFLIVLRSDNPQLAGFATVQPVKVPELQALLEEDTSMIIYHVLEDEVVAWTLSRNKLDVARTPIKRGDLVRTIETARLAIQNFGELGPELSQLSDALLLPSLPQLTGAKRVCIVPHRELHLVPFAALPVGADGYLIDRLAIFYMPSASVLRYTIERREGRERSDKVLGIGNPDRKSAAFDLPFAQKEAERLRFDFPDVTIRTGEEATESWLVENLQNFGVIHIASHGEYDPNAPLFSALLLAPDGQNDGSLSAQEIFSLQMRADLVALSACQTGLGRITSGDDIVGLNRAFVYAGTRQLLSTLWRVDDISTALLFKHFYRQSRTHDRAEALRQAQLIVRNRPEFRHPARWAGIALSGDWK